MDDAPVADPLATVRALTPAELRSRARSLALASSVARGAVSRCLRHGRADLAFGAAADAAEAASGAALCRAAAPSDPEVGQWSAAADREAARASRLARAALPPSFPEAVQ